MSPQSSLAAEPAARSQAAVTVALLGPAVPPVAALQAALAGLPTSRTVTWVLLSAGSLCAAARADLVICDGPAAARVAQHRWPAAGVLVLMPWDEDGIGIAAALESGAHLCVQERDENLLAAYLHSLARRRGLLPAGGDR